MLAQSSSSNGPWTVLNGSIAATTSSSSATVSSNGTYYFGVAACNASGCSGYTSSAALTVVLPTQVATLSLPPATPVNDVATHDPKVGTLAGQAGTDGGAAQYHVPIVVPPGRAGMQPELALIYNSRSGDGVMGVGWTISGLSSIHRCPQTPEQDGQTLGVSYTNNDRLCLDGQRLVAVLGNYGVAGTQYRTEVDSYARITQLNGDLSSTDTACFRVEQKNGRVLHYGGITTPTGCTLSTIHSRVKPGGAPASLSWLVERIEDRVGNNQVYTYTDYTNGEVLLAQVAYTGFSPTGVTGDRTVSFTYQPRASAASGAADVSSSYLSGGLTMQTLALQKTTTAVAGSTVRTYTPGYTNSLYNQRLLMTSLTECATDANGQVCHPATSFTYNDSTPNYAFGALSNINAILPAGLAARDARPIGDLDGDGAREVAVPALSSTDGSLHLFLTQITADDQPHGLIDLTGTPFTYTVDSTADYVDIDGDGRAELLLRPQVPPGGTTEVQGNLAFAQWKGQRGGRAESLVQPRATPSQNFAALFNTIQTNVTVLSGDKVYAADMNGDGKVDLIIVTPNTNCPFVNNNVLAVGVLIYTNTMTGPLASGQTATFAAPSGPLFCLNQVNTDPTLGVTGAGQHIIDHIADFDGDGIPDFYISYAQNLATGNGSTLQFDSIKLIKPQADGTYQVVSKGCTNIGLTKAECQFSNTYAAATAASAHHWMDVNGDGLEDFVYALPGGTWTIRLNQGGKFGSPINTGSSAGLDLGYGGSSFRYANRTPMLDVDGDGKPDLLTPSTLNANPFVVKMCTLQLTDYLKGDPGACPEGTAANPPVGGGGITVKPLHCPVYACPENPGANTLNMPVNVAKARGGYRYTWNNQPADGLYLSDKFQGGPSDFSSYRMDMLKFVQTGSASFTVVQTQTPVIAQLANTTQIASALEGSLFQWTNDFSSVSNLNFVAATAPASKDLAGQGLDNFTTLAGCPVAATFVPFSQGSGGYYYSSCEVVDGSYGPSTFVDGTSTSAFEPVPGVQFNMTSVMYVNRNQGVQASGNMGVAKATAAQTLGCSNPLGGGCPSGVFLPGLLNTVTDGLGDQAVWDYDTLALGFLISRDGIAEYTVSPNSGYNDSRHYYFGSSMPVVSAMLQSNGIGDVTGSRSASYGYSEAMYNHFGRGFQGFRTITVENISNDASRRLATATTFKQKFPLVGKVESTTTLTRGASPHAVHSEAVAYSCQQGDTSAATCPQDGTSAPNLPIPTGTSVYRPVSTTQTSNDYDLGTGAASSHSKNDNTWDSYGNLKTQVVVRSDDAMGGLFVTSHTTSTTNTFDYSNVSDWWINKLLETKATSSIVYAGGHALPGTASAPERVVDTQFAWNTNRTPLSKTLQSQSVIGDANQESTTNYTYPPTSYGLPTQVKVTGVSIAPDRTTTYGYSTDGYFVASTKNGLNQISTAVVQARDGQATKVTDPNNITINTTYDAFGRAKQVTHKTAADQDIESPINIALSNCGGGCGGFGSDTNETNAVYRAITTQQGYPTKVTWYDLLGRPIKQAQAGFSDTTSSALQYSFSAMLANYDENGTVATQSAPYYTDNGSPNYTEFGYDALNRVTAKSSPASCGGTMDTTYVYTGRQTKITASGNCTDGSPGNGEITVSRSTNVLGQLMQTVDANHKSTDYWTEPLGHVVAIRDVELNVTTASYNALGQRTQSSDPDQGIWSFSYDALGELTSQVDARGVVTTVTSRDALGRITRRQQVSPTGVTGLAAENLIDTWIYDPANGIGQVKSIARQRGAGTPPTNPTWSESYAYDSGARPTMISTTISEPGSTLNLNSGTSYDGAGRVDTQTYPVLPTGGTALSVKHTYTGYGQLDALSNAGTGYVYWIAQGENAWGHLTGEQYPGVITGSHNDYAATGQAQTLHWSGSASDVMSYTYDSFGNLHTQQRSAGSNVNTETYAYDALQRLTNATRAVGAPVSYSYSASGNITSKSDNGGTYTYGSANGCGPHAVTRANGLSYSCDANGNVISGAITAVYDADNHPRSIDRGGTMSWTYSALGGMTTEVSSRGMRYFGPNGYEQVGTDASAKQVYELGPVIVSRTNGADTVSVILRDRLGSTINVLDSNVPTTRMYDAFGKARNGDMSDRPNGTLSLNDTIHGFTKHDHADDVQLIHMSGRVYDYQLGRFLNVDPIIQNPGNSQSLNPYSYVGNNPLSGTDPTGYATCQASQVASTSECANIGAHTIVGEDGKKTTLIVGDTHSNIAIEGNVSVGNVKNLSPGSLNIAINPHNGAEDWIANGPKGSKPSPDGIGSIAANPQGCGSLDCYNVHYNSETRNVESAERTFISNASYGAINGITNELGRAMELMSIHTQVRYGADDFMLVHAPTGGMFYDIVKAGLDKNGFTTEIASHVAEVLEENRKMSWVVHSGGGAIFAEAARVAADSGHSLSNTTVAFDSGANNRMVTNSILSRGGAHLFIAGRFEGYFDRNNDAVPMIVGLRGGPIDIARSIWSFPKLFGPGGSSPHTLPVRNDE